MARVAKSQDGEAALFLETESEQGRDIEIFLQDCAGAVVGTKSWLPTPPLVRPRGKWLCHLPEVAVSTTALQTDKGSKDSSPARLLELTKALPTLLAVAVTEPVALPAGDLDVETPVPCPTRQVTPANALDDTEVIPVLVLANNGSPEARGRAIANEEVLAGSRERTPSPLVAGASASAPPAAVGRGLLLTAEWHQLPEKIELAAGIPRLGLKAKLKEGRLVVTALKSGGLDAWNYQHPATAVRVGDRIVAVNDFRGEANMIQELKSRRTLVLEVERRRLCPPQPALPAGPPPAGQVSEGTASTRAGALAEAILYIDGIADGL